MPGNSALQEPRVSVVTPFFNGKQYLRECVESVLGQTYTNFEYLLIDNHSTDGASEIARELAERDSRIRIIRPATFLPQVDNYNFALSQPAAGSAYVKVVAADDWLFPNCLSEMVALAETEPRIAIVSSYRMLGSQVDDAKGEASQRPIMSGRDACRLHLLKGLFLFGSPTTLLYRADVVAKRQPFFVADRLHPDTEAAFEILSDRDLGFVPKILSFSRTQAESEMGSRRLFGPQALDRFLMVHQYGRQYLDADEQRECLKNASRWHYSILAQGWLAERLGRGSEGFWQYHERGLRSVGERVRPELLAAAIARLTVRGVLSPRATAGMVRNLLGPPRA
jgi:glycosyltransferase involved in cell wall biosynthesis